MDMIGTFFFTLLLSSLLNCGSSQNVEYTVANDQRTEFPINIPSDANVLDVSKNQITSIDTTPYSFPNLIYLKAHSNLLTEFPLISNIGTHLTHLFLYHNPMTYIDPARLAPLVALVELKLSNTQLTSIPDVPLPHTALIMSAIGNNFTDIPTLPNLGARLEHIKVIGLAMESFTLEPLMAMPKVGLLELVKAPLKHLPNFFFHPLPLTLNIALNCPTKFVCDYDMVWIKLAVSYGSVTLSNPIICDSPSNVALQDLMAISVSDMLVTPQSNNIKITEYKQFDPSEIFVFLKVSTIHSEVKSRIKCAKLCTNDPECLMYSADGNRCVLTSTDPGTEAEFKSYSPWFVRK